MLKPRSPAIPKAIVVRSGGSGNETIAQLKAVAAPEAIDREKVTLSD
ncbi:hypothetical protein [Oxynema aestuarii]|uniref:Uncharacterized protein n=1 Tax=Oxynema aestuarii AP17 TaxID=2064643 RepID=A0A6H1TWT8_9CYAN|nr:hypothetical protein [Oxynema aestuarii]QIZ70233.1 hypothetical protein HCG48_06315 [Oxynema aestuarii AP17]